MPKINNIDLEFLESFDIIDRDSKMIDKETGNVFLPEETGYEKSDVYGFEDIKHLYNCGDREFLIIDEDRLKLDNSHEERRMVKVCQNGLQCVLVYSEDGRYGKVDVTDLNFRFSDTASITISQAVDLCFFRTKISDSIDGPINIDIDFSGECIFVDSRYGEFKKYPFTIEGFKDVLTDNIELLEYGDEIESEDRKNVFLKLVSFFCEVLPTFVIEAEIKDSKKIIEEGINMPFDIQRRIECLEELKQVFVNCESKDDERPKRK